MHFGFGGDGGVSADVRGGVWSVVVECGRIGKSLGASVWRSRTVKSEGGAGWVNWWRGAR